MLVGCIAFKSPSKAYHRHIIRPEIILQRIPSKLLSKAENKLEGIDKKLYASTQITHQDSTIFVQVVACDVCTTLAPLVFLRSLI